MTAHQWGTPELGVYFIRYAGHDLEVRRVPKRGNGGPEKQYQVIVNGILTDTAWSTTDAKTKAVKYAERSHKGQPILSHHERMTSAARIQAPATADRVKAMSEEPATGRAVREAFSEAPLSVPQPDQRRAELVLSAIGDALEHAATTCACAADLEAHQVPVLDQTGVSFTISGKLTMDATDALVTIRAAVELLREHGLVDCDTVVPQRVKL